MLLCQGGARFQRVEDGAGELSFEAADRFAFALAFGLFAFEVGACWWVDAALGDRDAVDGVMCKGVVRSEGMGRLLDV